MGESIGGIEDALFSADGYHPLECEELISSCLRVLKILSMRPK